MAWAAARVGSKHVPAPSRSLARSPRSLANVIVGRSLRYQFVMQLGQRYSSAMHEHSVSSKATGLSGLLGGIGAALRGFGFAVGNRNIWAVYARLVLALLVATAIIFGAMIYGLWTVTEPGASSGMLASSGLWALRIAGSVIVALAAPIIALFVVNLVFPMFAEAVFFAGLRHIDRGRAQDLESQPGLPLATAIGVAIIRMVYFVLLTVVALAASLIPVVGVVVGPVFQIWITAKTVGWELIDPYLDKRQMGFADQREYVNHYSKAISGFGLPYSFLLAIPLIGPLFFGLAQAASPVLIVDVLDPAP